MSGSNAIAEWRRETWASWQEMVAPRGVGPNVLAGLTVAFVALPLNLALALACGLPPASGIVTGVLAGLLAGLFGGSKLQVSGPEVALAPLTCEIVLRHGVKGLFVATFLAGVLQVALGALRLGRFIHAIPRPVVGGFLAAVGLLVLDGQLPKLFGLEGVKQLSHASIGDLLGRVDAPSVLLGVVVMACFALLPKAHPRIPGALVGLVLVGAATMVTGARLPMVGKLDLTSFSPALPPFADVNLRALMPEVIALALLASIDSLLSAVSVDAVTDGPRHDPNQELVVQGLCNMASSAVGGMPVAGAVVRSMASVQAGATTRLASVSHALALAALVLLAGSAVANLPLTGLAGILVVVGARLIRVRELLELWRLARLEALAFAATVVAILAEDFVVGVAVGLVVSLAHFAAELSRPSFREREAVPGKVSVVEVHGPIFFASHSRLERLAAQRPDSALVLDLSEVTLVDATGVEAMIGVAERLASRGIRVLVAGARPEVAERLSAAGAFRVMHGGCNHEDVDAAIRALPSTEATPASKRSPVRTSVTTPSPVTA